MNRWIPVYVLNNCFGDKFKQHPGLKVGGKWYAMTHYPKGVLIPRSALRDKRKDPRPRYLVLLNNAAPNIIKPTKMQIHSSLIENYSKL